MKKSVKRILTVCLTLCLVLAYSATAFASTTEESTSSDPTKKILYQDENVLLYQSKDESFNDSLMRASEDNYGNVWLTRSTTGSFRVHNTNSGRIGVTWKVESSSNDSHAQIYMTTSTGLVVLSTKDVRPSDGDVRLIISNGSSDYIVNYIATTSVGMRIMCWTYKA